jgi:hypothetical protein
MSRLPLALALLMTVATRSTAAQAAGTTAGAPAAGQAPTTSAPAPRRPPRNYNPALTGVYYPDPPMLEPAAGATASGGATTPQAPSDSADGSVSGGSSRSAVSPAESSRASTATRSRAADTGVYYPESPASGTLAAGASNGDAAALGIYHPESPIPPPGARETRVAASDSASARTRPPVAMTAADTLLAAACGDAPAGTEAPGLLAVLFRARTTAEVRSASAKQVGGMIAGESAEGESYVRFPADAGAPAAVADRLIRLGPVMRVAPVACPEPSR